MDFQNEYDSATGGINTIVSTQLSSALTWANVPGNLVKASSSTAGYVWGYQSNNTVWVCQLPCNGNWTLVDLSEYNISSVQDITTDGSNVYILMTNVGGKNVLLIGPATNQGTWNMILVPFPAKSIFSTNTYIWAQDSSNNKQKCPKPCTNGNWIVNPENKVTITSASTSSLYGKDVSGNALKSDENLQSGWSPISGLTGLKLASVIGQADQTALYGIDTSSKAYRCEGDCTVPSEVDPLDTGGYMPLSMSVTDKNLWMTSTTSGEVGNIFTRVDKPDYTTIMNNVNPLEQSRDKLVGKIEDEYKKQTNVMIANKQITDVVNFFTKFFKFDKASAEQDASNASAYEDKVKDSQAKIDQMDSLQPLLQKLISLLILVAVIYVVGSFLGGIIHTIAFVILAVGVGYIFYSSS